MHDLVRVQVVERLEHVAEVAASDRLGDALPLLKRLRKGGGAEGRGGLNSGRGQRPEHAAELAASDRIGDALPLLKRLRKGGGAQRGEGG
eukprot:366551-Chlamydomonas_euryale.AAC.1